jgi:sulfatase maturation enzyme AslB (radical SAM superfamily)
MQLSDLITCIDFEISSLCNAGCSVCMRRRDGHYSEFTQTYWSIDDVKQHIDLQIIRNLKNLILCGNFGDTMGNPDIVKIVKYFRENNPNLPIHINTNGGIGNTDDFAKLAELGVHMIFGLDGLGETNELYRVNVKWDKVLQNLNSFVSKASPGQLEIQFIMWAETTNQIIPMIEFIQSIGFGKLFLRKPYTTGIKTEVYNMQGESTHFLTEIKNSELENYLETFWDFNQLDELKSKLSQIDLKEKPLEFSNFLIKPKRIFKENPYKYNEVVFSEKDIDKFESITKQTCYSKNFSNPSDLLKDEYNVYITHDKLLMPCCMIPPNISNSIHHHSGEESPYQKEVLNKMLEIGFEKFSLKNTTLKNVFNSGVLHEFVYNNLINKNPLKMCKSICGKCK